MSFPPQLITASLRPVTANLRCITPQRVREGEASQACKSDVLTICVLQQS